MGKVQILAVLTMDGCLSSELYDKAHQDLCLDRCGLDEIRKKAFYRVTPDYSISMLHEWRKDCTNIRYLAEATPDTADYINGLLRMHAVPTTGMIVAKQVRKPKRKGLGTSNIQYPSKAISPWMIASNGIPIALEVTIILISFKTFFLFSSLKGKML